VVPYGAYDAKDGHMVIANLGEAFWPRICRALGLDELASDSRFDSNAKRVQRRAEVEGLLRERTRQQTIAELEAAFAAHDVPHAPVLSVSQVLNHPQTRAREMVVEVEHPTLGQVAMTGRAIRLPAHGPMKPLPPPLLGQHTAEVLTTLLGCSPAQVEQLAREDVIKLG
jgi:formyl-CoA transferase